MRGEGPGPTDVRDESDAAGPAGTPRWVKVFGVVALMLVVLAIVVLVTGRGGGHGPGRHSQADADTRAQSLNP